MVHAAAQRRESAQKSAPRVVIVGAGIAGLTVAHELARTGAFEIEVIEKQDVAGGKARTTYEDGHFREHSMRVLPGSYVCMHQILKELETEDGPAIQRLQPATIVFETEKHRIEVRGEYAGFFGRLRYLRDVIRLLLFLRRGGLKRWELIVFLFKTLRLVWIPERKVIAELSRLKFSEYVCGSEPSEGFEDVVFRIAEILVAAKSHASAGVVTRTLLEWFISPFLRGEHARRGVSHFDGPTSDCLIQPWVEDLKKRGVKFRFDEAVKAIQSGPGCVDGLETKVDGGTSVVADAYVLAVQHNVADRLLKDLKEYIPGLVDFPRLGEEWAHSVQFLVHAGKDHELRQLESRSVAVVDSPWSIGYKIYSKETWNERAWAESGLADDELVVTATISNCSRPGKKHKLPFLRCTEQQVIEEVVEQARLAERLGSADGKLGLDIEILTKREVEARREEFGGYGISFLGQQDEDTAYVTDAQMYIRLPGNLDIEPDSATGVTNLYLAGEYTRTNYRIPTMEKSCESGKRCGMAILGAFGIDPKGERVPDMQLPYALLRNELVHQVLRFLYIATIAALTFWLLGWIVS